MGYLTVSELRQLIGYTSNEISDTDLNTLLNTAHSLFLEDTAIRVVEENITEESNNVFPLAKVDGKKTFLADANMDGTVDSNDVTVYVWSSDYARTQNTDFTIDFHDRIKFTTKPSGYYKLTATYYYWKFPRNNTLIKLAIAYLTAYLVECKLHGRLPERSRIGDLTIVNPDRAIQWLIKYNETLSVLKGNIEGD